MRALWSVLCVIMCCIGQCIDDQDEEGTISEQEQMEDDKENVDEVQQLSKEGMCMIYVNCVCVSVSMCACSHLSVFLSLCC